MCARRKPASAPALSAHARDVRVGSGPRTLLLTTTSPSRFRNLEAECSAAACEASPNMPPSRRCCTPRRGAPAPNLERVVVRATVLRVARGSSPVCRAVDADKARFAGHTMPRRERAAPSFVRADRRGVDEDAGPNPRFHRKQQIHRNGERAGGARTRLAIGLNQCAKAQNSTDVVGGRRRSPLACCISFSCA